jgi:hypothetical protein
MTSYKIRNTNTLISGLSKRPLITCHYYLVVFQDAWKTTKSQSQITLIFVVYYLMSLQYKMLYL